MNRYWEMRMRGIIGVYILREKRDENEGKDMRKSDVKKYINVYGDVYGDVYGRRGERGTWVPL